jgi:hypothetical protein
MNLSTDLLISSSLHYNDYDYSRLRVPSLEAQQLSSWHITAGTSRLNWSDREYCIQMHSIQCFGLTNYLCTSSSSSPLSMFYSYAYLPVLHNARILCLFV